MPHDRYFAALPPEEIGDAIMERVKTYYADGRVALIHSCQDEAYREFYPTLAGSRNGAAGSILGVKRDGDQGERVAVRVGHSRNLALNKVAMITNPKLAWQPQARRYDSQSIAAQRTAKSVLEHFWHNRGLETLRIQAVEHVMVFGEGFQLHQWNRFGGDITARDPTSGDWVRPGDIEVTCPLPKHVIRDPWAKSWKECAWVGVYQTVPKHEAAALWPKASEAILGAPAYLPQASFTEAETGSYWVKDNVALIRFYHRPTAVLPRGREVVVLVDGTVVEFHDLEYGMVPITRRAESEIIGTPFGYSSFWEIVNIQQVYDSLQSAIATNQTTFAGQLIGVRRGSGMNLEQLGSSLSALEVESKDDVFPIQLTKSPPEVFGHIESLKRNMENLMGSSAVARGEALGERQSGSAMAVLTAQQSQNAAPFATSDVEALKDQGTLVLRMVQKRARLPLRIGIVSKAKAAMARELDVVGSDLEGVDRVLIDMGNPLTNTIAGRLEVMQTAAQNKIPVTADQFWQVMETGRLEPVTESITEEGLYILQENEKMGRGEAPVALSTDDALRHCKEHRTVLLNLAARENPAVVDAATQHFHQHYSLYFGVPLEAVPMDPLYRVRMMVLAGQEPPPPGPEQMALPPEGAPMQPPPEGAAPPPMPHVAGAAPTRQPQLPVNKSTGQRWEPTTGGGVPTPLG